MAPRFAVAAATVALLAVAAPVAQAARRVASPGGGGDCISAPCTLPTAINGANDNDEVVITHGDYGSVGSPGITALSSPAMNLNVHGEAGQPRPRIFMNTANPTPALLLSGAGTTARHFEIVQVGILNNRGFRFGGAVASDIVSRATGQGGKACQLDGTASLRNSVCEAPGKDGRAIYQFNDAAVTTTASFRNVTGLATSADNTGIGMLVQTNGSTGNQDLTVVNSILRGPAIDVSTSDSGTSNLAQVTLNHSNYYFHSSNNEAAFPLNGTVVDGGANQVVTLPLFTGPGSYHQAASSPTINAGVNSPLNGTLDVDGDLRTLGGTTDMGADELVPKPGVVTGAAASIAPRSARIKGTVNPNSKPATYRFQFGKTTSYGKTTALKSAGSGLASTPVSAPLSKLSPNRTYHYRVVAASSAGISTGRDRTFKTKRPYCVVPKLKGLPLEKAKRRLKKAHCRLGKVTKPKHKPGQKPPKLVVRRQSPKPGKVRANGTRVKVTLGRKKH